MNSQPKSGSDPIGDLARLLPAPVELDLPADRHRLLKGIMMQEIHRDTRPSRLEHRPLLRRPAILSSVLAAAAALAVAVPVLTGGGTPAYAVSRNPDGTITVKINEVRNPKALEADLNALGFDAVVDYVPQGKQCEDPRSDFLLPREETYEPPDGRPLVITRGVTGAEWGFVFDPGALDDGQTAVLEFTLGENDDESISGVWARISNGPVKPCVLVDSTGHPLGPADEVPGA
ncbi:hypothetical protein [Sphaerisporangium dianthi]|uniref:Uncharacterized protein n=1 Tax=Sphaerisporangium dianthi TaxID=1436120 RepID=A0ABV9CHR2_9ACTN